MPRKKKASKKELEKDSTKDLEKFAIFFEHQNSKNSAKKLLWLGVITITAGLIVFVAYTTRLQISAFTWDKNTLEVKNLAEQQWNESFEKQEKEKNISEIKKQVSQILQQITTTTVGTTSVTTDTIEINDKITTSTQNTTSTTSTTAP